MERTELPPKCRNLFICPRKVTENLHATAGNRAPCSGTTGSSGRGRRTDSRSHPTAAAEYSSINLLRSGIGPRGVPPNGVRGHGMCLGNHRKGSLGTCRFLRQTVGRLPGLGHGPLGIARKSQRQRAGPGHTAGTEARNIR